MRARSAHSPRGISARQTARPTAVCRMGTLRTRTARARGQRDATARRPRGDRKDGAKREGDMEVVEIAEAAQRLGISVHAVRRRLYSGQLRGRKEKTGRWLVVLEDGAAPGSETGADAVAEEASERELATLSELVDVLQAQVATLQQQLDKQAAMFQTQLDRREA
jgi:hypothetical protein